MSSVQDRPVGAVETLQAQPRQTGSSTVPCVCFGTERARHLAGCPAREGKKKGTRDQTSRLFVSEEGDMHGHGPLGRCVCTTPWPALPEGLQSSGHITGAWVCSFRKEECWNTNSRRALDLSLLDRLAEGTDASSPIASVRLDEGVAALKIRERRRRLGPSRWCRAIREQQRGGLCFVSDWQQGKQDAAQKPWACWPLEVANGRSEPLLWNRPCWDPPLQESKSSGQHLERIAVRLSCRQEKQAFFGSRARSCRIRLAASRSPAASFPGSGRTRGGGCSGAALAAAPVPALPASKTRSGKRRARGREGDGHVVVDASDSIYLQGSRCVRLESGAGAATRCLRGDRWKQSRRSRHSADAWNTLGARRRSPRREEQGHLLRRFPLRTAAPLATLAREKSRHTERERTRENENDFARWNGLCGGLLFVFFFARQTSLRARPVSGSEVEFLVRSPLPQGQDASATS